MKSKTCSQCREVLPVSEFRVISKSDPRPRGQCRNCLSANDIIKRERRGNRAFNRLVRLWVPPRVAT